MSGAEQAYLALVIVAMVVFMAALGYASVKLGGGHVDEDQRPPSPAPSTTPRINAVKSRA